MTAAKASKQIKCFVHLFGRQTLQNHPQFPFSDALLAEYEFLSDKLFSNGILYYRKRGNKSFNLHVAFKDDQRGNEMLLLRDHLKNNSAEREAYAQIKMKILNTGGWTLVRYNLEKKAYTNQLLARAMQASTK